MPENSKEALNYNAITIQDLIDDENLPHLSVRLTDFPPDKTIHHKDEDMLLVTDNSSKENSMHPPEDTAEELLESLLSRMDNLLTIAPPPNASLDYSSLVEKSTSVLPPMDHVHVNATSVVSTQVIPLPAVLPLELPEPLTVASPPNV